MPLEEKLKAQEAVQLGAAENTQRSQFGKAGQEPQEHEESNEELADDQAD